MEDQAGFTMVGPDNGLLSLAWVGGPARAVEISSPDAILTPTSPVPPFKLGERASDPLQMYLADIYTVTGSLAGVPGISVPCGKIDGKLPVGLQVFGPPCGEARVLQLAHAFEQAGGPEV